MNNQKDNNFTNSNYIPKYLMARLKYKCSVTLISLLEARKNDENVRRMMKSIDNQILLRNIVDTYHLFDFIGLGKYTPELFGRIDQKDPEKVNGRYKNEEMEEASFIIEIGFNLFIIMSIFQDIQSQESSGSDITIIQEEENDQDLLKQLTNSIIGQIYKFVIEIIQALRQSFEDSMKMMHKLAMGNKKLDIQTLKDELEKKRSDMKNKALSFFKKNTLHFEV
jgi:hypothetical protein